MTTDNRQQTTKDSRNGFIWVRWRDSNCWHGQTENQKFEVEEIITVGHFVAEYKDRIVVAQDVVGEEYRNVIAIPIENIIGRILLSSNGVG